MRKTASIRFSILISIQITSVLKTGLHPSERFQKEIQFFNRYIRMLSHKFHHMNDAFLLRAILFSFSSEISLSFEKTTMMLLKNHQNYCIDIQNLIDESNDIKFLEICPDWYATNSISSKR